MSKLQVEVNFGNVLVINKTRFVYGTMYIKDLDGNKILALVDELDVAECIDITIKANDLDLENAFKLLVENKLTILNAED